jgi:hypothetical protein
MAKNDKTLVTSADTAGSFTVTLTLPKRVRLYDHDGQPVYWDLESTVPLIGGKLAEVGGRTVLTNVRNGGGKEATEGERHAAVMKKLDAWKRGEFNVVERGESQYSAWREVFMADCIAAGLTTKAAEEALKAKVSERLGKDAKATFANFIEASAVEYAEGGEMSRDEARERLESYYASEADRRAKERAEVKVKLPTIDLAAFAKK